MLYSVLTTQEMCMALSQISVRIDDRVGSLVAAACHGLRLPL